MVRMATLFAERGIEVLTWNFPYAERGRRAPDPKPKLLACYETVLAKALFDRGSSRVFCGGKSMGGRMASELLARTDHPRVMGLVFLGFPLHPPGKPTVSRDQHLAAIRCPMCFVQGTRDKLGMASEIEPLLSKVARGTELIVVEGGDHSFAVPKSAGRSQEEVFAGVADGVGQWMDTCG